MSDEREFIENLLIQRFNFFIVVYSLILGGAVSARFQQHLSILLGLGTFLCLLLAISIFPLAQKLEVILHHVRRSSHHPAKVIHDDLGNRQMLEGIDRKLVGYWIPLICTISLFAGFILSLCKKIIVSATP